MIGDLFGRRVSPERVTSDTPPPGPSTARDPAGYPQRMPRAATVLTAIAVLTATTVTAYTAGTRHRTAPDPVGVHALRYSYPDLTRGRSTSDLGDLLADVCQMLTADTPTPRIVQHVQDRLHATEPDALNVVLDVWSQACPTAPTPNRDGEITPR